jgi:HAE1 family hydrophobic/amphiphilic exporter-1
MQRQFFTIVICVLAFGVSAAHAQTPTPTPVLPEAVPGVPTVAPDYRSTDRSLPDLSRVGVDSTNQRPLMLHDAIELALDNNHDIEISRKTERMAEFDLKAALGYYQPRLTGQAYYEHAKIANLSVFSNNTATTTGTILGNATLTGYYRPQGTVLTGSFNNTRLTSNNPISILSPQFNSNLSLGFTQPLFRGRKFDVPRRTIEVAKKNIELTDTQFRQRTIEIVAAVEKGYWDLTFALRNLQVQRDAVRDARAQLEHNRRLVVEGQLAPIDVTAAETQVANFEQAVYDALNAVNQAENALKNLISPNRNDAIWASSLTPIEPVELVVPDPTLAEATDLAMTSRPELDINEKQRDINKLDQRLYRDQTKPQIDLIGSYNSAGVGGGQNPAFVNPLTRSVCIDPDSEPCIQAMQQQAAFVAQLGNSASAFTDILANKYPVWRVGLSFNLPLFGDKTAKANLGHSLVEAERLEVQRQQIEQNIQVEVRNAIQGIRTAEARLRAASIARENSEKQYESERRKLDEGQSDTYKVLERQTALSSARSNELRARTDLNKAIAELERATGNTLKANNIETKLK